MRKIILLLAVLLFAASTTPCLFAADDCNAPALKANVDKASQIVKEKGKAGFEEVGKIRFCKDEGYIYITDINGLMLMHPVSAHLVGKSVATIKDPTGKLFYAEAIEKVKSKGIGWFHYKWPKPGDKTPSDKCGYAKKVTAEGQDYIVASGLYDVTEDKCKE